MQEADAGGADIGGADVREGADEEKGPPFKNLSSFLIEVILILVGIFTTIFWRR